MKYKLTRNNSPFGFNELDVWDDNNVHIKRLTGFYNVGTWPVKYRPSDIFIDNCTITEADSVEELEFFAIVECLKNE